MVDRSETFQSSTFSASDMPMIASWPVGAGLAECPHWIAREGALLWVDIVRPSVNVLDLATGLSAVTLLTTKIGSAVPGRDGSLVLALGSELYLQEQRAKHRLAGTAARDTHFNDGKCDPVGRFWVGSRSSDGSLGGGSLYRLDLDGAMTAVAWGFDVCNGMGWSPDTTAFYLIDTVPRLLYRYDYDVASGSIANRRVIQDFAGVPGKPDGMAVDSAGNLWCAMWDGGGILRLSPEGQPIGWLDTPCPRPTSCAFGGEDLRTLFVTTASHGLDPADVAHFGLSGSILAFRSPLGGAVIVDYGGPPGFSNCQSISRGVGDPHSAFRP